MAASVFPSNENTSETSKSNRGGFNIPRLAAPVFPSNENTSVMSRISSTGGFNIPPMTASVFPSNENISAMSNRSNTGGFKIPSMAASVFPSNENTSETSKSNRGGFNIPRMAAPVFPSNENTSVMSKISSTGGFNIPPMAASILPSNENISGMPNRSNTGGFKVPPMTSSVFPIYENTASYGKGNDTGGVMVPPMTASVFPSNENIASCGKSNKTDEFIGSSIAASVSPSLTEPNEAIDTVNKLLMATSDRTLLEQTAAQQLGVGIKWTPTNLHLAPMAMLDNFSNSFSSLLNARLKGWTLLVLKHSLSTRDTNSRNQLLKLLALTKLIETNGATTSFKASKRPTTSSKDGGKTNSMLLPLVFEARIEVSLNKKSLDVVIRAPGTISGSFTPSTSPLLESVKIELDTNSLVSNIIEEAHIILMKAVTEATLKPSVNHQVKFTKFKTALSLSKERDEKQTDKFKGEMTNLKKNASVSWNFPDQGSRKPRDVSKKAQAAANGMFGQLRSSKSFGKPDANTFECKRNATFADFGSADKSDNSKSLMRARLSGFKSTRNFTSAMDDDDLPRKNALFSAASMSLSNKLKNPFHQLDMAISDLSMVQPQADNARADTKPISGAKYSATALEQLLLLSKLPSKRKSQKTGLLPPTSEINN